MCLGGRRMRRQCEKPIASIDHVAREYVKPVNHGGDGGVRARVCPCDTRHLHGSGVCGRGHTHGRGDGGVPLYSTRPVPSSMLATLLSAKIFLLMRSSVSKLP